MTSTARRTRRAAVFAATFVALAAPATLRAADVYPRSIDIRDLTMWEGMRIFGFAKSSASRSIAGVGDIDGDGYEDIGLGSAADGDNYEGAAYVVFSRPRRGATQRLWTLNGTNGFKVEGGHRGERVGTAVAGAGDVNGDGYGDIVIGAPGSGAWRTTGGAYVLFGGDDGYYPTLDADLLAGVDGFQITGNADSGPIGGAVAGVGDLNGDGYDDVVIGGSPYDRQNEYALLVFGRKSGFPPVVDFNSIDGKIGVRLHSPGSRGLGASVSGVGDVNGDGYDDMIIGDPKTSESGSREGVAYVVFGHPGRFPKEIDLPRLLYDGFIIEQTPGEAFGAAVGGGHDVDGDGLDDIIVGDWTTRTQATNRGGSAYVIYGRANFQPTLSLRRLSAADGFEIEGVRPDGRLGQSVAIVPDVNGDGLADILLGVPNVPTFDRRGISYLVFGDRNRFPRRLPVSALDGNNGLAINGIDDGDRQGSAVAGVGDFDGDGLGDILTLAPRADKHEGGIEGEAYLLYGRWDASIDDDRQARPGR